MYAWIITICLVIILTIFVLSDLRNNRGATNKARDNNKKSRDVNRETRGIIDKLSTENREARELNRDIKRDNKTAGDIITEVRKQKLDR